MARYRINTIPSLIKYKYLINLTIPVSQFMNFLIDIKDEDKWKLFLEEKVANIYTPKGEISCVKKIIDNKLYNDFYDWIVNKDYLSTPIDKKEIIVSGKDKRRTVYCYSKKNKYYQYFFKYINYLLKEYDYFFTDNLYSFRSGYKIGNAVRKLNNKEVYEKKYKAKLDIHDYFRSIEIDKLIPLVEKVIDDKDFIFFLKSYLSINYFYVNNKKINDKAGVFPGNPMSGFLSNLFLTDLDKKYLKSKVTYFRYADDILIYTSTEEELYKIIEDIEFYLKDKGLVINPKKKDYFLPNTNYNFLGLSFEKDGVSISNETLHKIKGKIKRSTRKIIRWCIKKHVKREIGVKLLIKKYNEKFFGVVPGEQSWIHWYFPYIHNDSVLKEVDHYFYQEARYIMTSNHSKKGYKLLPYSRLKELGYRSLVREYHNLIDSKESSKN